MGPNQWCYQVPQYWATGGGGATVDCNHQIEKLLITNVSIHPSQPAVIITWLENRKITWMRSFSIPNIRQGGQIWLPTISFLPDHFYIARAGVGWLHVETDGYMRGKFIVIVRCYNQFSSQQSQDFTCLLVGPSPTTSRHHQTSLQSHSSAPQPLI